MSMPPASASAASQFTYAAAATSSASYFPVPFHLQHPDAAVPAPVYPAAATYSFPQFQQAHQLFQRDAQTITPEALEGVKAALASSEVEHKAESKKKALPRKASGQSWEDPTLAEWPENDYRLFCGDLGNEVNDDVLSKAFSRFHSFNMVRVVTDKRTGKTKGYGFVSFANPSDLAGALKEMNEWWKSSEWNKLQCEVASFDDQESYPFWTVWCKLVKSVSVEVARSCLPKQTSWRIGQVCWQSAHQATKE